MEVSEILDKVNIVDYISQYTKLQLKHDGEWWGLSPLKSENTPSFSVNEKKQIFYDFSTGTGGNLLNFIQEYEGCSFKKALEILKSYAHISDDEYVGNGLSAIDIAKRYRRSSVQKEVKDIPVLANNYMDRYSDDKSKLQLWADEGISFDVMDKFRVKYDGYSNRIVYPIRDVKGNIINVCGRTMDKDYKEKGVSKYIYFKSIGSVPTLYGLFENHSEIKRRNNVIIFEGAKSVLLAETWGIHNSVALLTSHVSDTQFEILLKLGVHLIFALDSEIDITKDKNIMRLKRYLPISWVKNQRSLLDEKDSPVDKGKEVFKILYTERVNLN